MRATKHISEERKGRRKRFRVPRGERGVALLMAIFGLLLLTAIAAAMLFSTNTETSIAVNYRDKEAATYAAVSGLQEARDRLQPLYGDLSGFPPVNGPGPVGLPDTGNSVLYIVNPDPSLGETAASIAPWSALDANGNPNPYFDKELCQEKYPAFVAAGVTGTVGVPCTTFPAGSCFLVGTGGPHWCHYLNNSTDPVWGLQHPLPYKWVRITLKADNSGPVWVQTPGSPATGAQVCFKNGPAQQIKIPPGASNDCWGANTFSVSAVSLSSGGAGYSSPPAVSFIGGGGSGASATATLATTTGGIDIATLTNNGSGYTSPPNITITNPDGIGAAFAAKISGSPVTGVTVGNNNYCYETGTTGLVANFNPTPPPTIGGSATTSVNMTSQVACISGWTATTTCAPLKNSQVTVSSVPGAGGSGFIGIVNIGNDKKVTSSPIQNVGSYTSVPAGPVSIDLGSGCTLNATFTGGIRIQNIAVTNGGGEYVTQPTATISGQAVSAPAGTTQPPLNVQWAPGANNGQLSGIHVTNPGSGYAINTPDYYTLGFSGGGGSGATGKATSTGATNYVSGLTLTSGGSGYTSPPQVVIGGPGSGATATAFLGKPQQLELGAVYMLTSLARTMSGSTSMAQMEAGVMPPSRFQLGGALTLDYASPSFGTPNSEGFQVIGDDASASGGPHPAGCDTTAGNALPAIGVYDQNAVNTVTNALGKPENYISAQTAPNIVATSAANPPPSALQQEVNTLISQGAQVITGPATSIPLGSPTNIQYIVVNGDLTLSGNPSGYGVLLVTGNLTLTGDFTWHGVVMVIGSAVSTNNGGGNGQITGAMYVGGYTCTTSDPDSCTRSNSTFDWTGGGGNGIQYDHCWADYLLNQFPPVKSEQPLQILSTRMLEF